jgi:hypothetical protein
MYGKILYKKISDKVSIATNRLKDISIVTFDNGQINVWIDDELIYNGFSTDEADEEIAKIDDGKTIPKVLYRLGGTFKNREGHRCTIVGMYIKKNKCYVVTDNAYEGIFLEDFRLSYKYYIGQNKSIKFIEAMKWRD